MIKTQISFDLPVPWKDKSFSTDKIGAVNFLVGPNGSGKSKFAEKLRSQLRDARMLGTDRLRGMEQVDPLSSIYGDRLKDGLAKNHFTQFKNAGQKGSGIDTVVLLEERMDLRIQVEATLSHLFDRKILLEWDSGNLVPKAILGESESSYRLDRDECHGIKELLILLTHLYNDQHPYLIVDEPELNLHPQYQAFFMQEVRKHSGVPARDGKEKIVFLVTHSPFILDFRTVDDVMSVFSFDLSYSVPRQISGLDAAKRSRLTSLVSRLNVHHKQLFFSDNPVFVEGTLDSQIIAAIQEARGVSIAGAGSCLIDAGGSEEVNKYLDLCKAFGKKAHFLYDLDSLFRGSLRACVREDGTVQSFLATAGMGMYFGKYCGQLEAELTNKIDMLLSTSEVPESLNSLVRFLKGLGDRSAWDKDKLGKARVALLTAISQHPTDIAELISTGEVQDVQGRVRQIVEALQQKYIHLLPGGTLERYLPNYTGDLYQLSEEAKRKAVIAELEELAKPISEPDLEKRYGELYAAVRQLPVKTEVDVESVLREYLGRFIHDLQVATTRNPTWARDQLQAHLRATHGDSAKVFSVKKLNRGANKDFEAIVSISSMLGQKPKRVRVTHLTNAGMGEFELEDVDEEGVP